MLIAHLREEDPGLLVQRHREQRVEPLDHPGLPPGHEGEPLPLALQGGHLPAEVAGPIRRSTLVAQDRLIQPGARPGFILAKLLHVSLSHAPGIGLCQGRSRLHPRPFRLQQLVQPPDDLLVGNRGAPVG